jgi:hypothetical protein
MPSSATPGSSTSISSRQRCRHRPSPKEQRLGTPKIPAIRFPRGGRFRGFHGSHICYGLPVCSAPCTDLAGFPANGAFYIQAFNGSVTLPVVGYDYSIDWTPCMGLFLSMSFRRAAHFFPLSVSLFDLKARFFVPTRTFLTSARAGAVKVGRRASLAACSTLARPHRDSSEHDGPLGAVG